MIRTRVKRLRFEGVHAALVAAASLFAMSAANCTIVDGAGATGGGTSTGTTTGSSHDGGAGGATSTGSTGGSAGSGPLPETGRALFESTCQQGLLAECGPCHNGTASYDKLFLTGPDYYDSVTHWPYAVVDPAYQSILLVHPQESSHGSTGSGDGAPDLSPDLRAKMTAWLELEATLLPKVNGKTPPITPLKPYVAGAFNAIYLDPLGPEFINSSITFNAELYPAGSPNPTLLRLSNLEVHPIAGIQIHIVHPLFTVYPPTGAPVPDVADSYSGFDQTYALDGSSLVFGTGELILTGFSKDARVGIAFEKIEVIKTGGVASTCKDVVKFQAEVVPQLKKWGCFGMCHNGTNIAAQQQMDLANIDAMPPDDACAQVRARIAPGDPDGSQIFQVTNPLYMGLHGFKFAGNKNNYNAFKAAVSPWVVAEQ